MERFLYSIDKTNHAGTGNQLRRGTNHGNELRRAIGGDRRGRGRTQDVWSNSGGDPRYLAQIAALRLTPANVDELIARATLGFADRLHATIRLLGNADSG